MPKIWATGSDNWKYWTPLSRSAVLHWVIHFAVDITGFGRERFAATAIARGPRPVLTQAGPGLLPRVSGGDSARAVISAAIVGTTSSSRRVFAGAKPRSTMSSSRVRSVAQ